MKVKIQNIKNPKITMEVKKEVVGLYLGTKEWQIYKEDKNFKYEK